MSGGRIVVAGGFQADGGTVTTVEIFDPGTSAWSAGPPLPLGVNHAMAAAVDGAVYVFGGYLSDGSPSAAAFRLAVPAGGSAGPGGTVPAGPSGGAPAGSGGSTPAGPGGSTPAGPGGVRWQSVADLPEGRAAGAVGVIGATVYLAAGIGPGKDALAGAMLVYDTRADRWTRAPGPPTRREHLGGAVAGGVFYTVGGRTAGGGNLAVVESYDPGAGAWTRRPDLPTARGGLAAAGTCQGAVVAAGGEGQSTFSQVEAFTPETGGWQVLPPMPNPRHGLGMVTLGAVLFTLPGGPRPGLFVAATTESLDLTPLGACH